VNLAGVVLTACTDIGFGSILYCQKAQNIFSLHIFSGYFGPSVFPRMIASRSYPNTNVAVVATPVRWKTTNELSGYMDGKVSFRTEMVRSIK